MSSVFRNFVRNVNSAFHGSRNFASTLRRWRTAIGDLGAVSLELSRQFGRLPVTSSATTGAVMVGRTEGRRFASLLRGARSVEAIEGATGARLSFLAKRAFRRLDETAKASFPDAAIARRRDYVTRARNAAVDRGSLRAGETVLDAGRLEVIVRSDAALLDKVNRASKVGSRTKRILYLGGAISVSGVGVAYLCGVATEHAARNTGCFMYTNGGTSIVKCRVPGCSCPLDARVDQRNACDESSLWEKMRVANSACRGDGNGAPYCVHCDWSETNSDSVNYVDRDRIPADAYVHCEKQDAFDALTEIIGGTIEDAWNAGRDLARSASASLGEIARYLPYVLFTVAFVVIVSVVIYAIRLFRPSVRRDD